MTKNKTIILAALICGASLLPVEARKAGVSSQIFSTVATPTIPKKVNFAGQNIDIDRIDMYERLDRELTSMAYTHGNTLLTIKRANRYFPQLIPILRKNGIPEDLIYLACIESYLNPLALSPAKAAGMWQFMPTTGEEYGLEVNEYVDERYDPVKSTEAACKYLAGSLAKYGNWESVAASYNAGVARISKELESQRQSSAFDLYLNDETSRYIYRLIAMKLIMESPKAYGYRISADKLYPVVRTTTVEVSGPVDDWVAWAAQHSISYLTLKEYNPWIRAKSLPNKLGKTYKVNIPVSDDLKRSASPRKVYNRAWVTD